MINKLYIILLLVILLCSCSSRTELEKLNIGISAYEKSDLMVKLIFDDRLSPPAGAIGCCWGNAQKNGSFWGAEIPHKVKAQWWDYKQGKHYRATLSVQRDKAYKIAGNLSSITHYTGETETDLEPYIIFGFGEKGEVKMWISNAPFDGVEGRILEEIGSAQATWELFELTDDMFR
ncbi:hypothetical protein CWB89_03515 [Pseudoalteromonas piscicida]|uniref:DUF2931 family protein n=2 Tax=Pseudoalteromonas piscicida TaxID=43662 RepID=A0AAQ2IT88_PSEO7|nr:MULTISPECIES: hypothetical protein [Pseudoalteromonas]KJY85845.1 hypothetical protein TW75_18705 [Pseudoalteromonas piscicida]TMN41822.1 hypothetical protein CWB94_06580 [Pseudoalteromonas piscicida]TMN48160.1 hypothetical protein CWB91_19455 [Pseudoalteromonas piscicida]TMN54548.1 hypothetical protein CWB92_06020 [Pseudoalteromonas piscicida]TMN58070.1 hypothetical protein CWB93_07080 [Pseudoalteromonas piscicida]